MVTKKWFQDAFNDNIIGDEEISQMILNTPNFHKEYLLWLRSQPKKYYYMITLTLRPEHHDNPPIDGVEKYIQRLSRRRPLKFTKFAYSMEYTTKGVPHWHLIVICEKYLSLDRFTTYAEKYGFVDISKNHSQKWETMVTYITKTNEMKVLIN